MEPGSYMQLLRTVEDLRQANIDLRLKLFTAETKVQELLGEKVSGGEEEEIARLEDALARKDVLVSRIQRALEEALSAKGPSLEMAMMLEEDVEAHRIRGIRTAQVLARYRDSNRLLILELKHKQNQYVRVLKICANTEAKIQELTRAVDALKSENIILQRQLEDKMIEEEDEDDEEENNYW